ncbi:hypothetical protein [Paraburkholderia youngii]|uniref:hypothetical protein n=1 Tax=Paraburkholderia youngii TaxID=2782701 RepID=UPI003D1F51A9
MTIAVPHPPEWGPLEKVVRPESLGEYMFMGIVTDANVDGDIRSVHLYKNRMTRAYLIVDAHDNFLRLKPGTTGFEVIPRAAVMERHSGLLPSPQITPI